MPGLPPRPELYTVAGHVAHAADSADWFIEGGFGEGWNMEFEALIAKAELVVAADERRHSRDVNHG